MRRELNPALDRVILDTLAEKYKLFTTREPNHLSTYIYCLTKAYFEQRAPIPPTDRELLLFATGYAMQEVLTPRDATAPIYESEGIIYRPDSLLVSNELHEIKSTRSGVKRYRDGSFPETWLKYMRGGCHLRKQDHYHLSVIYLSERPNAALISETIYFEQGEIEEEWRWIQERKEALDKSLSDDKVLAPRSYCEEWECEGCRYSLLCEAVAIAQHNDEVRRI